MKRYDLFTAWRAIKQRSVRMSGSINMGMHVCDCFKHSIAKGTLIQSRMIIVIGLEIILNAGDRLTITICEQWFCKCPLHTRGWFPTADYRTQVNRIRDVIGALRRLNVCSNARIACEAHSAERAKLVSRTMDWRCNMLFSCSWARKRFITLNRHYVPPPHSAYFCRYYCGKKSCRTCILRLFLANHLVFITIKISITFFTIHG